jgi:hypothetical protein
MDPLIKSLFTLYQINDNIRIPQPPAPPSVNNLSSTNSGYLDKELFKDRALILLYDF